MFHDRKPHALLLALTVPAAAMILLWPSLGSSSHPALSDALVHQQAPATHSDQGFSSQVQEFRHPVVPFVPTRVQSTLPATYTVLPSDVGLSTIAAKLYGNAADWPVLYYANGNTTIISAGEVLKVPPLPAVIPAPPAPPPPPSPSVTPSPQPTSTTQPAPQPTGSNVNTGALGACIRNAENGSSYAWGTGNGGGAYQFEPGTWASYAPSGAWGSASPAEQDAAFLAVVAAGPQAVYNAWEHGTDTCPSQFGMY